MIVIRRGLKYRNLTRKKVWYDGQVLALGWAYLLCMHILNVHAIHVPMSHFTIHSVCALSRLILHPWVYNTFEQSVPVNLVTKMP